MEETNSIYGDQLPKLEEVREQLVEEIQRVREKMSSEQGMDPVEHCLSRIKSEESRQPSPHWRRFMMQLVFGLSAPF